MLKFFRNNNPKKLRKIQYKRFALAYELTEASNDVELLVEILNLEGSELITAIYNRRIEAEGQGSELNAYFLDYIKRQKGTLDKLCSVCLLSSKNDVDNVSLRILAKLPQVLESLGASASGGEVVLFGDDEFDNKVTTFAKNSTEARALDKESRDLILQSLFDRNLDPELRIGANFMLFEVAATEENPTDLTELEKLMTDLLSLYVLISKPE